MKNISKNAEPKSLTNHRCQSGATYEDYNDKDNLRDSLCREQGRICCYCMQRIEPSATRMKIEHWECQTGFPSRQLDYSNLLGACLGGMGKPFNQQHCDTRKGSKPLSLCPSDKSHNVEAKIRYLGNGEIEATNPTLQNEIDDILNLNCDRLVRGRDGVLDAFQQTLGKKSLTTAEWEKRRQHWSSLGKSGYEEFCQVVLYYINKKLP